MSSSSLIAKLKELIAQSFHIAVQPDHCILISEQQSQAKCQWVKLQLKKKMPYFGFSIDKPRQKGQGDPIFPYFNTEKEDVCTKNDAILFFQKEKKIYVLLIELKSNHAGDYLKQLKAGQGFIEFILKRISLLFPDIDIKVEYRGVLFTCRKIPDEGTTKKQSIEYKDRKGLPVTQQNCHHRCYFVQQFLK